MKCVFVRVVSNYLGLPESKVSKGGAVGKGGAVVDVEMS
jgi:hypothetical protein